MRCAFSDKAVYWFVWRLIYPHAARQAAAVAARRDFNLAAGWYRNFLPPCRGAALRAASRTLCQVNHTFLNVSFYRMTEYFIKFNAIIYDIIIDLSGDSLPRDVM